jgi:antitoxin (DNA-binding transcriptional repressor) of toxin-antitoxin stability system
MQSATISELKNRLSHYLRLVRQGEAVLIRDRDRVIARIEPAGGADTSVDDEAWLARLERRGIARRPTSSLPDSFWERRPVLDADLLLAAVLAERDESR